MSRLTVPSPAKINLFLHITGRRADGYHELQTLFQLLDLSDTLHFAPEKSGQLLLNHDIPGLPAEDNLILRAARLLQQASGCREGASIELEKHLPIGGGVGGGSSNAATTLLALNQLWKTGLSLDELEKLSLRLGADVPVFVRGRNAWAEGIGEKLSTIETTDRWYLLVAPPCHVSTEKIFSHSELTRNSSPIKIRGFLGQGARNDCQNLVRKMHPEVDKALNWLAGYAPAMLTGTGSCIFAGFDDEVHARLALKDLPADCRGFVAKTVQLSPAHKALGL